MTNTNIFRKIAVIGAGTMGGGIAGQIANAGHKVLLLDLPGDDAPNAVADAAVQRLLKSDPPALMHKSRAALIETGNIRDDFDKLADCDWIIEAVVERLPIKKALYQRLNDTIGPDCIVSSNTSTIPIRLLVEDMPESFRKRFAITHYFNPVRYMRLLELVRGVDTDAAIIDILADFNDRFLGKGVVICNDTPGFLGNRVGVFALQVGMDEAFRQGLLVEEADALMGRPMGIPKTGVFGLYDLIGVDLMSDVVNSLGTILPQGDAFHAVGAAQNPVHPLITSMIANGFTGDKGKGGFYRTGADGAELAIDLHSATPRPRISEIPARAQRAAQQQAANVDPLPDLIKGNDPQARFCRAFLARVLGYAAQLLPEVTQSPQNIDDAMKLGFNWVRGPFEMIDALGADCVAGLIREQGLAVPAALQDGAAAPFYSVQDHTLLVRHFDGHGTALHAVSLPENTVRFHMYRRTLTPIAQNEAASLFELDGDLRLVEFHSKANALTRASMEMVVRAALDPGRGVIIHNDAQHYSAGVDLNAFRTMIEAKDWHGINAFLADFQAAVAALKYCHVPVIGAPSGLAIGGGYEVLAHCSKLVLHANTVLGLVEAGVGVVPGGGGVKETFLRWYNATGDWSKAAWYTWKQIGYGQTGTSPQTSARLQYALLDRDEVVMNRDKLITTAVRAIADMRDGYRPPAIPTFTLPGRGLLDQMSAFMDKGIADGLFFPHDKTVAMEIATIVVNTQGDDPIEVTEQEMFARERTAFIALAKTPQTLARITSMLDTGNVIRN